MSDMHNNLLANPKSFSVSDTAIRTRAIGILNVFRLILSLVLIFSYLYIGSKNWTDKDSAQLFLYGALAYLAFSVVILVINTLQATKHWLILPPQILIDIAFIVLLMHAAGGAQSGLGLLLIIIIVIASLVSNGRLALFYAAIASIGLLLEQSYQIVQWDLPTSSYAQPVMLSLSCFATAWLAYSLASRMQHSEALASARGVDLENLAQVNALITQEMQDGVIVVDADLNIRHHNLQAEVLLSLPADSTNITLSNNVPSITDVFNNWVKGNDVSKDLIVALGSRELKLRFKPTSELRSSGAVIFIQDWSQIQSAAQQAKLAALGRLTANIAHEIRNPLSAISHANQLLQEEENLNPPSVRMLEIIADNTQRIDQIIKDVLELNRRDRTHQEKIELNAFLTNFYVGFCAVERIPTSHFQLAPCQKQHMIAFDQRHLTQILWNLCKNGWDHSHKQTGSLKLHCIEIGKSSLSIEIQDDGHGVAEQDRVRLFEPFFTTKNTGNGLGLYISRELAEANGASLQYQALAQGSAFIVHLKKAA